MRYPIRFVLRLALAFPALICFACSGGGNGTAGMMNSPTTVEVQILDNSYDPQSVRISPGDTVRWVLVGSATTHTVTALSGAFDSGFVFLAPGDTFERTFNEVNETFEYSCVTHGDCCSMQGSIRVGANAPDPRPGY